MMHAVRLATLIALGCLGVSAPAFAAGEPTKTAQAASGQALLTDQKGMTLYVFDKDMDGKSMCNGPCATNWPPLAASADAKAMGKYTVITRDDGIKQWAYQGKPLYTWAKDGKPGDTTGDGVNSVWHVAKP